MRKVIIKLLKDHKQELIQWIVINLTIPLTVILLTLTLVFFNSNRQFTSIFYTTLFNGSFPLTAINILVIGLFSILTYNKHKEDNFNLNLFHGRFILLALLIIILIVSVIFYVTQAIHSYSPETDIVDFTFQILIPICLIIISCIISGIFFLFSEEKIQRSFGGLDFFEEKDINSNRLIKKLLCKQGWNEK